MRKSLVTLAMLCRSGLALLLGPLAMGLKTLAMGLKTLAMLLLMSGLAFAGSVEQVQSAESAREREAFERFVEKAGEAAEVKVAPEVPVAAYPEGMFRVETIALEGNTILSASYLQAVFAKYENREIGFKEVQELIQILTNAYIESKICWQPIKHASFRKSLWKSALTDDNVFISYKFLRLG